MSESGVPLDSLKRLHDQEMITDRAVVAFLACHAQVLREIDRNPEVFSKPGEKHADVLVARLRYYLLEGLHG